MSNYDYDLIIVGAGPGGYITAERAAKLGLKTAIVEKGEFGGVCLNIGCIPTKTLLKNAKIYHYFKLSEKYGISFDEQSLKIDWGIAQERKAQVVKKLTSGVQFLMKSNKVDMLIGSASAVDRNTIKLIDKNNQAKNYSAKYIIIATGSSVKMFDNPNVPVTGLSTKDLYENKALLSSTEILSLKEIPKSLTIIGGGVIGIEFACLFSSLGTKVTIIEYLDSILALLDADVSKEVAKTLKEANVDIITGHSVAALDKNTLTYYAASDKEHKNPLKITSDYFLLSTGRQPNSKDFNNIGLQIKPNGAFAINNKLQALDENNKEVENIFVIGDANGQKMLAHVASAQGLAAVNNILVLEGKKDYFETINYDQMPNCVYTFPEISSVGLTETEAKKLNPNCLVKKIPFAHNGKALAEGQTEGFVKLIVEEKYGEILGAHILGMTATDMIAEIVNIMVTEGTIFELANSVHPHPTLSEPIMEAAQELSLMIEKNNKK